ERGSRQMPRASVAEVARKRAALAPGTGERRSGPGSRAGMNAEHPVAPPHNRRALARHRPLASLLCCRAQEIHSLRDFLKNTNLFFNNASRTCDLYHARNFFYPLFRDSE